MKEVIKILNSNFTIKRIILNNFTVFEKDLHIEIDINSEEYGRKRIYFIDSKNIYVNPDYSGGSPNSSILIEDISILQWENLFYKITVVDDAMRFYCRDIILD